LIVVGKLESKKAPVVKNIPGRLISRPSLMNNFWVGANGVSIPAGASWGENGHRLDL